MELHLEDDESKASDFIEEPMVCCKPCKGKNKELSADFYCTECDENLCGDCLKVHKFAETTTEQRTFTVSDKDKIIFKKCEPCEQGNISTSAVNFCDECKEYLCDGCTNNHKRSKVTKSHVPVKFQQVIYQAAHSVNCKTLYKACAADNKSHKSVKVCETYDELLSEACTNMHLMSEATNTHVPVPVASKIRKPQKREDDKPIPIQEPIEQTHNKTPIQTSLLKLENPELNKLAVDCFICIMKFMGDYPMSSNQSEMDCVLKVLRACHKYPKLRDEVYCQLCKQTTNNRSMKPKSCIMGWRLFAIIAAYCDCSESFRPNLFKYLETVASDTQRTYSGAGAICLQNLRKTFKYGGRKNVPLKEEIDALANGRISKRISFIYSGSERGGMLHVKFCSVVRDCIEDVCSRLDIVDQVEVEEYNVFLRTRDGQFSRLRNEEYILDVTAELLRTGRDYDLVFQRTVWYFPYRSSDNLLYNELMYFQCLPDYVDGLLVMTRDSALNKQYEMDILFISALIHGASDHVSMPTLRDLDYLVPGIVRSLPSFKSQHWLNRIHEEMKSVIKHTPPECMDKFVEVLSQWPLFGSTFFRVKKVLVLETQQMYGECILAVNKSGILFLDIRSHEIFLQYTFGEVLFTRRYRSDSNQNYLDMKLGNLMGHKIVRIETEQGSNISNLIGEHMQVINRHRKRLAERWVTAPYQTPTELSY